MSRGEDLAGEVRVLRQAAGRELPEDRNAIERLQYAYGYFIDNRMFR